MNKGEKIAALTADLLAHVNDVLNEINALASGVEAEPVTFESSWGLTMPVKGQLNDVTVPDAWVREWAVMCDGDVSYVVSACRDAIQWVKDNPSRRKTQKGARAYLGGWVRRNWHRDRGSRPRAGNSLKGYGRRNGVDQ
jgi:hypothetical protein